MSLLRFSIVTNHFLRSSCFNFILTTEESIYLNTGCSLDHDDWDYRTILITTALLATFTCLDSLTIIVKLYAFKTRLSGKIMLLMYNFVYKILASIILYLKGTPILRLLPLNKFLWLIYGLEKFTANISVSEIYHGQFLLFNLKVRDRGNFISRFKRGN